MTLVASPAGDLLLDAVFDGYQFGLRFGSIRNLKQKVFSGDRFRAFYVGDKASPFYRYWRLSPLIVDNLGDELFAALMAACDTPVPLSSPRYPRLRERFNARIEAARAHPRREAFLIGSQITICRVVDREGDEAGVVVRAPYHPLINNLLKQAMGGSFLASKAWHVCPASALQVRDNLIRFAHVPDDCVQIKEGEFELDSDGAAKPKADTKIGYGVKADGQVIADLFAGKPDGAPVDRNLDPGSETDKAGIVLARTAGAQMSPLASAPSIKAQIAGYPLYDFQRDGVLHLVSRHSALLADDMGLGKSRQAVCAADIASGGGGILVACPASLTINWQREINAIRSQDRVAVQSVDPAARWVVMNYERLDQVLADAVRGRFAVMIIDEAHLLKEPGTNRTETAFEVAGHIPYRFLLTGTPILNHERELYTLLQLSGHELARRSNAREFMDTFGGSEDARLALNRALSDWMLRRMKESVLNLPGKVRAREYIDPTGQLEMNGRVMSLATEQQRRLWETYQQILKDARTPPLPRIMKLRRVLEQIKMNYFLNFKLSQIPSNEKVIVFTEFAPTVDLIKTRLAARGLDVATLVGSDPVRKRQAAIDRFQGVSSCQYFAGTTMAAGVGTTLTAGNNVYFCLLPWTHALRAQAEDRAHRNGQTRPVTIITPHVVGSIDEDIEQLLDEKQLISAAVVEGKGRNALVDPRHGAEEMQNRLAKRMAMAA